MQTMELSGRDEPTRINILVPVLCALVQVLDGYDLVNIGLAVPSLAKEWSLPPSAFTQAFALSSVGIMIGAMIAGPLGARFGRRPTLLVSVLVFGLFSLASTWASSLPMLVALRFMTGLGIGGAMPTTIALTADYVPARWRATIIMFMFCGNTLGGFLAGQVASATIPTWGWHAIFFIGGVVPLAMLPVLFLFLPEARHFAEPVRGDDLRRNPVAGLFQPGLVLVTLLLWLIFLINLLDMYLLYYWLPTVLTLDGLTAADAAYAMSIFAAGGVFSTIVLGIMLARLRAEWVLAANMAFGVVCIFVVAFLRPKGLVLDMALFGAGWGFVGSQLGLNGFAAAAYPKELRSTGAGWALGVGRLGGIIGPVLGGALIALGFAAPSILLFICGPGIATVLIILVLGVARSRNAAPTSKFSSGVGAASV